LVKKKSKLSSSSSLGAEKDENLQNWIDSQKKTDEELEKQSNMKKRANLLGFNYIEHLQNTEG
jgi:hypothetical protein